MPNRAETLGSTSDQGVKFVKTLPSDIKYRGGVVPKALQDMLSYITLFGKSRNTAELSDKLEEVLSEGTKEQLRSAAEALGGNFGSVWSHLSDVINVYFELEELGESTVTVPPWHWSAYPSFGVRNKGISGPTQTVVV